MLENGVQERLPSYPDPPDPEQLLPRSPNQALGSGPSFSVKRTIVRFREAAEGPGAKKANNYYQFWRLQVWALGWRSEQLFVFLTQAGTDPNKKTPSR